MTNTFPRAVMCVGIALLLTPRAFADVCRDMIDANSSGIYQGTPISKLDPSWVQVLTSQASMCGQSAAGADARALEQFAGKLQARQEQAKGYKQELVELIQRTRALPADPSSNAAVQKLKERLIEIRNESGEAFSSSEWRELDSAIREKIDAIETGQTQQTSPGLPSSDSPSLQNFADQSSSETRISEMTCSAKGTVVLGVVNMGTEDPESVVRVALTSTGNFVIEGREVNAFDVLRSGEEITFSMISVADYLAGTTGVSTGLSDAENMQFHAMQKIFIEGALNGRRRFAIYDVANSRLTFADAEGQQFKNITEADCWAY
ncbi:hypothetical protein EN932_21125 [Mesorhizobium sp. M7A.F.Ca.US.002.01.1.1]|uniref:hypothetical protein n=1 Tax=Mesorhizobium sp. M7A.F.Ca.US.002.01.1.1 TaxID=2496700 RepID=UPI000FD2B5A1|nr:hypothetical protein [Mesorhizobium sp. M7A.F.Ca.US.002.01.1.1]RVA09895.1 hypothetical protein EN932_21125 [Mesorhizobium sp. M7A.F.Ca.US.002.01.1.1]